MFQRSGPFGRLPRARVAAVHSEGDQSREARYQRALDEARLHAQEGGELEQRIAESRGQTDEDGHALMVRRYHYACMVVYIRDLGVYRERGHQTPEEALAEQGSIWPGKEVCPGWRKKFNALAEHVPEPVVLSGNATMNMLVDLSRVRSLGCQAVVCEAILAGESHRGIWSGIRAARASRALPESEAMDRVAHAIAEPPPRAAAGGGVDLKLVIDSVADKVAETTKKAVFEGIEYGRSMGVQGAASAQPAAQAAAAQESQPATSERRRTPRAPEPPAAKAGAKPAPEVASEVLSDHPEVTSDGPGGPAQDAPPTEDGVLEVEGRDPGAVPAEPETEPAQKPYQPPPRPYVDPQGEAVLAIYAHPSLIHDMTRAERLCYRILGFAGSLTPLMTEWVSRRWKEHEETFLDLQLLVFRQIEDTREVLSAFASLMEPAIAGAQAAEPPEDADEAIDLLLEWVLHDNADPLHEPDPNHSEKLLWTVLGQLPLFNQDLAELTALREQGGEQAAIDHRLLRRLGELLPPLQHLALKFWANLSVGAGKAYQAQQAEAEQLAAVEAARGPRESRIIVVGADALPPAHGFVGKTTLDDRLVTWSLWEPSLTLMLGDRGKGKSHFIRVLTEAMSLRPAGLAFLKRAQCPILIDSDFTQGQGRFEMLEGFFPNHDAAQLAYVHQFYQTEARNLAFRRALLLCHKDQVAYYKKLLAPYVERGLIILPLALGIPDLGGFGFEVLLEQAVGGDEHAVYKNLIQSLVAEHGDGLKLGLLRDRVLKLNLRSDTKETVVKLFDLLGQMYTETESVMQHVGECPVFTLLRGKYLPKNFVNPMQAVLFNAFCRSTANGDPPRVVMFEEFIKVLSGNAAMQRFVMNFAEELRHRPVSAVGGLQHLEKLGKGLWGAADNHLIFGLSNPQDLKRAQVEVYRMRHLRFPHVAADNMPAGRAILFARRSNTPELSQGLYVVGRFRILESGMTLFRIPESTAPAPRIDPGLPCGTPVALLPQHGRTHGPRL